MPNYIVNTNAQYDSGDHEVHVFSCNKAALNCESEALYKTIFKCFENSSNTRWGIVVIKKLGFLQ